MSVESPLLRGTLHKFAKHLELPLVEKNCPPQSQLLEYLSSLA
jgi:hypothetical protein